MEGPPTSDHDSDEADPGAQAAAMKEVWFRTPVLLGSTNLLATYESERVRYKRDTTLHENLVPPLCERLPNGMVIDLPNENIADYVERRLAWLPLKSDNELVEILHRLLLSQRSERLTHDEYQLQSLDLLSTPLFKTFNSQTQSQIVNKLQQLKRPQPKSRADLQ